MTKRTKTARVFIALNGLAVLALLYFLYSGFYYWAEHWVWLNPSEHGLEIRNDFKLVLGLSTLLPLIILIITKKPIWLLQPVLIVLVGLFWKSDILQRTVFRTQACSSATLTPLVEQFIRTHEGQIRRDVALINRKIISESGSGTEAPHKYDTWSGYYEEGAHFVRGNPEYILSDVYIINHQVVRLSIHPTAIKHDHFQGIAEIDYYPGEDAEARFRSSRTDELYPWDTHLFGVCTTKHYLFQHKWIVVIEGGCFG